MKNWILKTLVAGTLMMPGAAQAQGNAISKSIHIDSSKPSAMIDPMLYGQLF